MKMPGNSGKPNPIRQQRQQAQGIQGPVTVDPSELVDIICGACGCPIFLHACGIKKLSGLHPSNTDPTHQDQIINAPYWICGNCGQALITKGPNANFKEKAPGELGEPEEKAKH